MVTRGGNRSRSFEVSFEDIIIKRILLSGLDDFDLHPLLRMKYGTLVYRHSGGGNKICLIKLVST